jgi:hypothetical protein
LRDAVVGESSPHIDSCIMLSDGREVQRFVF